MSKVELSEFEGFFLDESSVLELEDPNGEPLLRNGEPVKVHLYGPATDRFSKAKAQMEKAATAKVLNTLTKGKKKEEEDPEADAKFLCAVTEKFENFPFPGGAEAIYREPRLKYITEQVQRHLGDMGNFYTGGKKA